MTSVFELNKFDDDDDEYSDKIDIDELYEKKKNYDLNKISTYKKILARIHVRIKTTSRQCIDNQYCWYVVPEIIIGVPKYDHGACIAFLLEKLQDNGFISKYIHPNVLFISWNHWVPTYVRDEIRKKTGMNVDGNGNIIDKSDKSDKSDNYDNKISNQTYSNDPNDFIIKSKILSSNGNQKTTNRRLGNNNNFRSINSYSPMGIYKEELMRPFKK
tara:strand:+ start:8250 stop:8894 length:645 start_codon:yes stop_codon:yes gene_type:complete